MPFNSMAADDLAAADDSHVPRRQGNLHIDNSKQGQVYRVKHTDTSTRGGRITSPARPTVNLSRSSTQTDSQHETASTYDSATTLVDTQISCATRATGDVQRQPRAVSDAHKFLSGIEHLLCPDTLVHDAARGGDYTARVAVVRGESPGSAESRDLRRVITRAREAVSDTDASISRPRKRQARDTSADSRPYTVIAEVSYSRNPVGRRTWTVFNTGDSASSAALFWQSVVDTCDTQNSHDFMATARLWEYSQAELLTQQRASATWSKDALALRFPWV